MAMDTGFRIRAYAILVATAVIVIGLVIWSHLPQPGVEEFQQAQQALRQVRSWRMRDVDARTYETREQQLEVVCPNTQRLTISRAKFDGTLIDRYEYLVVEGQSYAFNRRAQAWERREESEGPAPICDKLARGLDTHPFPPFAHLLEKGTMRKGEIKTVEGVRCQVWAVKVFQTGTFNENEEVCLRENDHLPVERVSSYGRYLFSDWNAPLEIKAPFVPPPPSPEQQ